MYMTERAGDQAAITGLLRDWRAGDREALDRLMPLVAAELRHLARIQMRGERADLTLQPTALVNELYLRLVGLRDIDWRDRQHFFSMAARLMRRVLVDAARRRRARKRGRSGIFVTLDDAKVGAKTAEADDILAVDEALTALAAVAERKARVVELRFFGGLTVEESAAVLEVSPETIARDWRTAKLWLRREMTRGATR
jgi:RNA polymerase sigma-70 factor (ECF subfamily)